MTKRDVVTLASKILGFYTVVYVVSSVPQTISAVAVLSSGNVQGGMLGMWLAIALSLSLYGLIAWFLITRADKVGLWLYPEEEEQVAIVALDRDVLLQVALMAIGVFLIARGLTGLPGTVFLMSRSADYGGSEGHRDAWAGLLRVVLQVGIGFYLALGAHGTMRVIEYLRRK